MKIVIAFLLCIIYLSLSIIVFSSDGGFLYKLKIDLSADGWSEEEITSFMHAAQNMNWESIENGYVDVVAFSLLYCKRSGKKPNLLTSLQLPVQRWGQLGLKMMLLPGLQSMQAVSLSKALTSIERKKSKTVLGK